MGYTFTNKQPLSALNGQDGIEIGKQFDKVYAQIGGQIDGGIKIYEALLSQNAPIASQTSGTFTVGQIWTINTYVSGVALSKADYKGKGKFKILPKQK